MIAKGLATPLSPTANTVVRVFAPTRIAVLPRVQHRRLNRGGCCERSAVLQATWYVHREPVYPEAYPKGAGANAHAHLPFTVALAISRTEAAVHLPPRGERARGTAARTRGSLIVRIAMCRHVSTAV